MRTTQEIIARAQEKSGEFLSFQTGVLVGYLSFDDAKPFLVAEAKAEDWKPSPLTREQIIADMKDYMAFAWGKARDHRGLSAGRSVDKMEAWIWLLGDEPIDRDNYANYGCPILKAVCERYGFDIPEGDDIQRMSRGETCRPDCDEGCGA